MPNVDIPTLTYLSYTSMTWHFPVTKDIRAAALLSSGLNIKKFKLKYFKMHIYLTFK